MFNDKVRDDICWLEFWVWICSDGKKPNEDDYMRDEPIRIINIIIILNIFNIIIYLINIIADLEDAIMDHL